MTAIDRAGRSDHQVVVLSKCEDCLYNRVRYTLASIINGSSTGEVIDSPIRKVLMAMIEAAFSTINLESHSGAHPRIGVVDDLAFHPLGQATMEDAASLAKLVASDIGNVFQGVFNLLTFNKDQSYKYLILTTQFVCSSGAPVRSSPPNRQVCRRDTS